MYLSPPANPTGVAINLFHVLHMLWSNYTRTQIESCVQSLTLVFEPGVSYHAGGVMYTNPAF